MLAFLKNQTIFRNGIEYRIDRRIEKNIQIENSTTGEFSTHDVYALLAEYAKGALTIVPFNLERQSQFPPTQIRQHAAPSKSPAAQSASRRQIDYIVKLIEQCAFNDTKQRLINAIAEISQQRNETTPPHVTTVYRWHKQFQQAQEDIRGLFSKIDSRGGKNKTRLSAEVEAIIDEKIESTFLAQKKTSAEVVHNAVFLAITQKNTTLVESEWFKVPSLRTIQRRLHHLHGYDVAVACYGQREADRRFAASYLARVCSRLNVPRPARGYWAKLAVGKAPTKPSLPEARVGDEITWDPDGGLPEVSRIIRPTPITKKRNRKATASAESNSQHELIAGAKNLFLAGRESRWSNYLKPAKKLLPEIHVTKAALDSALELADALFKQLEQRGQPNRWLKWSLA